MQILWILIGGAFGGLIKSLIDGEHKLMKPVFVGKYFYMGFLANVLIGIGTAIIGMGYLLNVLNPESASSVDVLHLLATSISFGIASNVVIEGVIEKVRLTNQDKSI